MKRTKRFLLSLLTLLCCNTGMWASSIPGALSGRFTINASGEKVLFSQGNLQYQASTDTWRFAENQYDYIGSANSSISESYTGWIDLFGWATNGLEANTATGKMPYYTGTTDEDYGPSITSGEFDKTIYDWGKAIDDSWHTLSNAEWNYIFAGRASYSSLYGFGRLFGVNGVFLLPDDWSWSETSIATAATAAGFAWSGGAKNFSSNIISNNTLWSVMESAGAVFIPAAGYRQGTTINMSGNGGDYWSSTASSDKKAYRTSFYNEHLNLSNNYGRSDGISVRLVRSSLEKDGEGNYLLSSAQDWKDFAAIVNSGTNPAANAKMTADIDLGDDQTMIGTGTQWSDYGETGILRFQGVFDGQGHTLTINYNATTESFTAPFRHIKKATIKNLRVAGTITTNHTIAAGIASSCAGNGDNSYIINCVSSVDIISNYVNSGHPIYDGARTAGIIGQIFHNAHINISDCIFNGSISGETQQVLWGGMVGSPDGPVTITNSLQIGSFDCSDVVTGNEGSGTFSTIWNKNINITNSYYLNALGAVQGTQATSAQLADGTIATALQNGRAEEVWVQDLVTNQPMLKIFANAAYTVPSSGIGTFSAKAKFTVPEGLTAHYCKAYDSEKGTISVVAIEGAVPANTGVILKGEPGETYTLTGTNDDAATVTDNALVAVTEATHVDPTSGLYTNFMMKSGKFIRIGESDESVKMSANKAYLQILTSALPSDPTQARDIVLSWDEEDPTGINEVRGKKEDVRGEIYNLSGQRVSKPTKGLYIIGGKKVFIY